MSIILALFIYYFAIVEGLPLSFLHITDVHLDLIGSPNYGFLSFCRKGLEAPGPPQPFGRRQCDSPSLLLSSLLEDARSRAPGSLQFVLNTGDSAAHQQPSWESALFAARNVSGEVQNWFPEVPVITLIGNNDVWPDYAFNSSTCGSDVLPRLADAFRIPPASRKTFLKMGAYSTVVSKELMIVGLNTVMYSRKTEEQVKDPCGQFNWLDGQLQLAEQSSMKVIIAGHIPPIFKAWGESLDFVSQFYSIVGRFVASGTVTATVWGHRHSDGFFANAQFNVFGLMAPAVTPVNYNPTYRLVSVGNGGLLTDYQQVYLPLRLANDQKSASWVSEYRWSEAYGSGPISWQAVYELQQNLADNSSLWNEFSARATVQFDAAKATELCVQSAFSAEKQELCNISM